MVFFPDGSARWFLLADIFRLGRSEGLLRETFLFRCTPDSEAEFQLHHADEIRLAGRQSVHHPAAGDQ